MRHGKKINHLSRTASHRKALMSNLANELIAHKRITTTLAKAKSLRKYVEPLITKSKDDSTHSRRVVFSYLNNKESIQELFSEISERVGDRPGGYTRIIKLGQRQGDAAEMAMIELVDFNDTYTTSDGAKAGKKRRRRRKGSGSASAAPAAPVAQDATPEVEESAAEEAAVEEAVTEEAPVEEAATEEAPAEEAATEEAPVEEAATKEAPAEEAATEEAPAEEAAAEEAPVEETATEEAPVEEAATEEAPAEVEATEEGTCRRGGN